MVYELCSDYSEDMQYRVKVGRVGRVQCSPRGAIVLSIYIHTHTLKFYCYPYIHTHTHTHTQTHTRIRGGNKVVNLLYVQV